MTTTNASAWTEYEVGRLRMTLADMGNTSDTGVFVSRCTEETRVRLLRDGLAVEDVAVRRPEDQQHWRSNIAALVETATRVLSVQRTDWHLALSVLREAEEYERHMHERKLWLTESGLALVNGICGTAWIPIHEYTRI